MDSPRPSQSSTVWHRAMSNESKHDLASESITVPADAGNAEFQPARPPIVYTSFSAFTKSVLARWKSLWTRRFIFALLAGQVVSFCITATSVTTQELNVNHGWVLPTTQTWFLSVPLIRFHGATRAGMLMARVK